MPKLLCRVCLFEVGLYDVWYWGRWDLGLKWHKRWCTVRVVENKWGMIVILNDLWRKPVADLRFQMITDFLVNMSASADVLAQAKVEVGLGSIPEGKNVRHVTPFPLDSR